MAESKHPQEEILENKAWCWSKIPATNRAPCQRSLHTGVVLDNSLYIFGGYDGVQRTNEFCKFNFTTLEWTLIQPTEQSPSPRDRHVSVVYSKSVYINGGYDGYNRVNDFYEFNTITNTWKEVQSTGNPPSSRHSHAAVVYEGCMYVFAGYDGLYRNDFHKYDFSQNCWKIVTDSLGTNDSWPKPRYRTTATIFGDKMLVFGGHDGARQLNDFYAWSFTNETWTEIETIGSPPSARDSHVAVAYKSSLFIFGGSTGNARSDFYEYKFNEQKWIPVSSAGGTPPCSRFCHIGVAFKKGFYVFGGYDGTQRLNDFKMFMFELENSEIPPSTLVIELGAMVGSSKYSDVTVIVEGKAIHSHKFILSRSKYFEAMFSGNMIESSSKEISISNLSFKAFWEVLKYLYTDMIENNPENALEILEAADLLCLDRLKKICEQNILASIDIENAATVYQAADLHSIGSLKEATLEFILANFDKVSKSNGFKQMARANVELVLEILNKR